MPPRYIVRDPSRTGPGATQPAEETLAKPKTARVAAALAPPLAAALLSGACDRLPEAVILPEFELSWSFESGLEGWTAQAADVGAGSWGVDASPERATDGARSLRLSLVNPGGAGKVWLTRELEATPGKRYNAEIAFDLATSDHTVDGAWKLILGARSSPPDSPAALDFQGDTASGQAASTGLVWVQKRFTVPVQADDEGLLYVSLGIWGTTAGTRAYWIDNVQVVLTRTS